MPACSLVGASSSSLAQVSRSLPLAGGGVAPHQPLDQMLADQRLVPEGLVGEEGQHGVAVLVGLGFDGPPEEQRNVDVVHVFAALGEVLDDRQRLRGGQPAGGAGELAADFDVGLAIGEVGQLRWPTRS